MNKYHVEIYELVASFGVAGTKSVPKLFADITLYSESIKQLRQILAEYSTPTYRVVINQLTSGNIKVCKPMKYVDFIVCHKSNTLLGQVFQMPKIDWNNPDPYVVQTLYAPDEDAILDICNIIKNADPTGNTVAFPSFEYTIIEEGANE